MTPATTFAGRRVALFGLGGSGIATALSLQAGRADVVAGDDSPASLAKAEAAGIATADLRDEDWSGFAALILSPGVPLTHPAPHWTVERARAAGIEVIGDIELFCRERAKLAPHAPFVAITGTNGKSTTTALVAHILHAAGRDVQMGGNIGTPILALEPPANDRVHVVELSSFQIDLTPSLGNRIHIPPHAEVAGAAGPRSTRDGGAAFAAPLPAARNRGAPQDEEVRSFPRRGGGPTIGVLLNITADHLDRHGTMEEYAAIKERVVLAADLAVVGTDDASSKRIFDGLRNLDHDKALYVSDQVGPGFGMRLAGSRITADWSDRDPCEFDLDGVGSLRGAHNAQNAAVAIAVGKALGLNDRQIMAGLSTFPGLHHRMENVGHVGRTLFVNDSKATNADSAEKALNSFQRVFWILGGKSKEGGIEALRPLFTKVVKAYLIGVATEEFAVTLEGAVPFSRCETLDRAVAEAAADAASSIDSEPVVLLSPACASYDQFPNFERRGDRFRDLVRALPGAGSAGEES